MNKKVWILSGFSLVLMFVASFGTRNLLSNGGTEPITIFAASSMAYILEETRRDIETTTGISLVVVDATSSTLARQIEAGAPADVFITADIAWLDDLAEGGHLEREPETIARNRLVLVYGAHDCEVMWIVQPKAHEFLDACARQNRLASGNPETVPLGKYAQQFLGHYGLENPLAGAASARAALALVETGAVPGGVLYKTDAVQLDETWQRFEISEKTHTSILYWAVALKQSNADATQNFLNFLQSDDFKTILRAKGFEVD